jgi:bacteriophage N4 adsorption protein B
MESALIQASPPNLAHLVFVFSSVWEWIFGWLAVILLISGIDDFIPLSICVVQRFSKKPLPRSTLGEIVQPPRRIAIFVPCWKESKVIGNMVRHNISAIRYSSFDFFLGVYPNDQATVDAATQLSEGFTNVHVAACPHPGPTSKADCLNWIYRRMQQFEEQHGAYFDTVVLHDAEDIIHPEALALIDRERVEYAMVQVPVLPLPTPFNEVTHGVYCDEFAEFQFIDMHARLYSKSFLPSNGVGTGFAREILQRLETEREQIFDAASLTEDYEIGLYIHSAGYKQIFAPLKREEGGFIATREYFPRTVHSAIRQRTRWITGIALQCWERRGWQGSWRTRYWFWRDRKGLIANPLSLLTNILFVAGLLDGTFCLFTHRPWDFAVNNPRITLLCWLTLCLQAVRMTVRVMCASRIFGLHFALGVPLRSFLANLINCCASLSAIWRYVHARFEGRTLIWLKTDHAYPVRELLAVPRRDFAEVLVSGGFMSKERLAFIVAAMPEGADLAEHLFANGMLTDEDLCRALSMHAGIPYAPIEVNKVKRQVARSLPVHLERRLGVVAVAILSGRLIVAGQRVPTAEALEELKCFTSLSVEFQLVTPSTYAELRKLL